MPIIHTGHRPNPDHRAFYCYAQDNVRFPPDQELASKLFGVFVQIDIAKRKLAADRAYLG